MGSSGRLPVAAQQAGPLEDGVALTRWVADQEVLEEPPQVDVVRLVLKLERPRGESVRTSQGKTLEN